MLLQGLAHTVSSWPLVYISRRGLAGLSGVLAPIYRDKQKGLKFKLELEPRGVESQFHAFCHSHSTSPPGLPVILLPQFGQRAPNMGGPVVFSGLASRAMGEGGPLTSFCIRFWREEVVTVATEFLGACKLEARASWHRPCRLQQCEACIAQSPYILRSSLAPAPLWNPLLPHILPSRLLWKLAVQILVKCCLLLCL